MAIVGIDLGTTTSEIAFFDEKEGPRILKDARGHEIVDSYFGFDQKTNQPVVGEGVKSIAQSDPELVVEQVKRHMREDVEFTVGEQQFTPAEVSAQILTHLKKSAEQQLGETVDRCVITVPANFPDPARRATKQAGEIAGMRVERIINEPTAAALSYSYEEDLDNETLLVYDFGGGTFDVSIVEYKGTVIDVKASSGDTNLGGKDFDQALVAHVASKFEAEHDVSIAKDSGNYYRLLFACEAVKKDLSVSTHATVNIPYFMVKDGEPVNLQVDVRRETFEDLIRPMVEQTESAIDKALADANLDHTDIDRVLMVGGSSRIPFVQQFVEQVMGLVPHKQIDPDKAIALGAAVQTAMLEGTTDRTVQDVCPLSLGTVVVRRNYGQLIDGQYSEIIPTNSKVAKEHTREYTTAVEGQKSITLAVYQRDSQSDSLQAEIDEMPNEAEGFTRIDRRTIDIPSEADGNDIEVTYVYNPDGMLDISVTFPGTDIEHSFQAHAGLDEAAIAKSRSKVEATYTASDAGASNAGRSPDDSDWDDVDWLSSIDADSPFDTDEPSSVSESETAPSNASSSSDTGANPFASTTQTAPDEPEVADWTSSDYYSDVKSLLDMAEAEMESEHLHSHEKDRLRGLIAQMKQALADNDEDRVYNLEGRVMDMVLGLS